MEESKIKRICKIKTKRKSPHLKDRGNVEFFRRIVKRGGNNRKGIPDSNVNVFNRYVWTILVKYVKWYEVSFSNKVAFHIVM